jgi:hypothetical protein
MITAFKVFTHDLRLPVQGGGAPIWSGTLPYVLPRDEAGWLACGTPQDALCFSGLWPNGRPSRLFVVETSAPIIKHDDRLRADTWTLIDEMVVDDTVRALSRKWLGVHADVMAREQLAWHAALLRPTRNVTAVEQGLRQALETRGLPWQLKLFNTTRDAWNARTGWNTWAAWNASAAKITWATRTTRATRDAWGAWDAWHVTAAWDASAAWDALIHYYAATMSWVPGPTDLFTVGLREAYTAGLAVALPTRPNELGWAMEGV